MGGRGLLRLKIMNCLEVFVESVGSLGMTQKGFEKEIGAQAQFKLETPSKGLCATLYSTAGATRRVAYHCVI